jgi:hypothetical protein
MFPVDPPQVSVIFVIVTQFPVVSELVTADVDAHAVLDVVTDVDCVKLCERVQLVPEPAVIVTSTGHNGEALGAVMLCPIAKLVPEGVVIV